MDRQIDKKIRGWIDRCVNKQMKKWIDEKWIDE